ncbi:MAG: HD domain-containing protein [Peptostreptococcales bacterium]
MMVDYKSIKEYVMKIHSNHPFAGYDHVERVHGICMELSQGLDVDEDVLRVAAYLHDIAVPIYGAEKHYEKALDVVEGLLRDWGLPEEKYDAVFEAIRTHTRYSNSEPKSLEAKILKDADGIDYLGAVGILRGVLRGYTSGKYKGNVSTNGKILLNNLIDTARGTFSTEKGKKIAEERMDFIKNFIERLDGEINID